MGVKVLLYFQQLILHFYPFLLKLKQFEKRILQNLQFELYFHPGSRPVSSAMVQRCCIIMIMMKCYNEALMHALRLRACSVVCCLQGDQAMSILIGIIIKINIIVHIAIAQGVNMHILLGQHCLHLVQAGESPKL